MSEKERWRPFGQWVRDHREQLRLSQEGLARRVGITDFHFHDLRHTATTFMDAAGVSSAVKMNLVGHSSIAVHQRYNNLSSDVLKNAADAIDAHIRQRLG